MDCSAVQTFANSLTAEIEKIIIGKQEQIRYMIMSALSGGHILLEDLPGSGKTTLIKTLSIAMGCDFKRIQFTPDLLPSDIIGVNIYDQRSGEFRFVPGPIHTHLLLADEINRAIPRTQSALLEAMEERQATIDGTAHPLPQTFLVMATQNPVESESTFRLPAAQMDRFFIRLSLGYPTETEEVQMLTNLGSGIPFDTVRPVSDPKRLEQLQTAVSGVFVHEDIKAYIISLVQQTRSSTLIKLGASPRASRSLFQGGKTWAAMQGRDYVTPDDIQTIALPVLAHRIQLTGEARFAGKTQQMLIQEILQSTPVPPLKEDMLRG